MKMINIEIGFIFLSFILLFFFIIVFGYTIPLNELAEKICFTKMNNDSVNFYFWLIIMYVITLLRQLEQKFTSYFTNCILIIVGGLLFYFFSVFAINARHSELTIEKDLVTFKAEEYTWGVIVFRLLQLSVGFIILLSVIKSINKYKFESLI